MTTLSTIRTAFRALRRNPTRALLTTLGIVIGIAAVIAMMEIGAGSSKSIQASIANMGVNTLVVLPGAPRVPGAPRAAAGSSVSLTPLDAAAIKTYCDAVAFVSPIVRAGGSPVIYGALNWTPSSILGVGVEFLNIRNWQVVEGEAFTEAQVEDKARVCLVGQTVVKELFNGESPIGSEIRVKNVALQVIGVLDKKGSNMMGSDEDDTILIPWTTARTRITGLKTGTATSTGSTGNTSPGDIYPSTGVAFYPEQSENLTNDTLLVPRFVQVDQIMLSARNPESVAIAEQQIEELLRRRHKLGEDKENDFWIRNSAEFMKMLTGTSELMSKLLLVVALISLVVGGVGIMNIMLVSVTERTREIGLRMAVGARSRDILKQFLIESIILCLAGGILGILLGHGAALLVNMQLNWPIESSPTVVAAACLVSALVGIVFGFYPAYKASRLDPIEALRYE